VAFKEPDIANRNGLGAATLAESPISDTADKTVVPEGSRHIVFRHRQLFSTAIDFWFTGINLSDNAIWQQGFELPIQRASEQPSLTPF
jgi:hypothetical protein